MRGWVAARVPTRESLLASRFLRPIAHRLTHPLLWHFNRWSVSRGVALGLFTGLLLPFGQTPVAALLALTIRANLIVAAAATFITNPITNAPIFYAAYRTGDAILPVRPDFGLDGIESQLVYGLAWLASVSLPTAVGLFLFALIGGSIGYGAVQLYWRVRVHRKWRRRRCRAAKPPQAGAGAAA